MPVRSCKVSIPDMEGVEHTVEVTASSLYEAVALGLAAVRSGEWSGQIAQGLNCVRITATNVPVEYEVTMKEFLSWLDRKGGAPRDVIQRDRVRSILGMKV